MKTIEEQLHEVEQRLKHEQSRRMFERYQWLKTDVINNVFYHTTAEIRRNVATFMDNIMKEKLKIIDRLCIRM